MFNAEGFILSRIAFLKGIQAPMAVLFVSWLTACGGGGGGGGGGAPAAAPLLAGVIALPKTGQTSCYNTSVPPQAVACSTAGIPPGQDGAANRGVSVSPRFTVGTGATMDCVTDNLTGLMWVRAPSAVIATWANALTSANGLTLCGFSDWRLPNIKELESLVNIGTGNQADFLNIQGFTGVQVNLYWSSSSSVGFTPGIEDFAWFVNMDDGSVDASVKSNSQYVWPVRAGQ